MANCEECRAAFSELDRQEDKSRAHWLDEHQPQCCCQGHSVSPFSIGPVADDEVLIRVVVAPQHLNKKKTRPTGATVSAAEFGGLSVIRQNQATDDIIRSVAVGLIERARANQGDHSAKVGVFGVLQMRCGLVRAIKAIDEQEPAYCVYDTALPNDHSHAEAFQRVNQTERDLQLARRQRLFLEIEASFVPVAEFRGGLLNDLAPADLA